MSISTLLMRLGAPSFSTELAQHIRLCGRDKDAIAHAKMILGVAEEQAPQAVAVLTAPTQQGAAKMTEAATSTLGAARMTDSTSSQGAARVTAPAARMTDSTSSQGAARMTAPAGQGTAAIATVDQHRLKFGLDTPPALFMSTDIRERQKEGE